MPIIKYNLSKQVKLIVGLKAKDLGIRLRALGTASKTNKDPQALR